MKVALIGNQNSGKTTLFNCLTGMNAKIGNWPGVTVEKKTGIIKETNFEIIDLPGIYSLSPYSTEESVSRDFILKENPDVIINIVDATSIERSLYLTTQLLELDTKVIIALNMADILEKKGIIINEEELSKLLMVKVIKISALRETGIDKLISEIYKENKKEKKKIFDLELENLIEEIEEGLELKNSRFIAVKILEKDKKLEYAITEKINKKIENLEEVYSYEFGYNVDLEEVIATKRYKFIDTICKQAVVKKRKEGKSDKLDEIFLNKWLAFPIFAIIMFIIYYLSVGIVGLFFTDVIIENIDNFSNIVENFLINIGTNKAIISLITDGIIKGVGTVLGFIPQLAMLFLCISILETTGYMARVTMLLDKAFKKIGLNGKSLIPFIVGLGCSVPGIMSTRIIENEDERKVTTVLTPFIPCSAKLPIIVMFSGYFFKEKSGIVSVSLYFVSILVIVISAVIMKKFIHKNTSSTYIFELPEYKLPNINYVFKDVIDKVNAFIKRAGSIILICSIVIWFLLSFSFDFEYGVNIENSILASIGKSISWVFIPIIGVNSWEATVSSLQGLIAKEQVVSSINVIAGFSNEGQNLFGESVFNFFTKSSAYSFMIFNLFSAPCFGAIGAMEKELRRYKKSYKSSYISNCFCMDNCIYNISNRKQT